MQGILKDWAADLAARPLEVKKSVDGRAATKACQQAADTLKGFFKLCSKRVEYAVTVVIQKVPYDIRSNLLKIADQMDQGEFSQVTPVEFLVRCRLSKHIY